MNNRRAKDGLYAFICIILAIAIILVLVFTLSNRKQEENAPLSLASQLPEKPEPTVIIKEVEKIVKVEKEVSSEIIRDGLRDMGFLVTQEYYFTEVVSFSKVKKFLIAELPFTETSYLASYDGVVSAGLDFSKIQVEKDDEKKIITITLPDAVIYSIDLDPNSFQLYSEKTGIGNPLSASDFNSSMQDLEKSAQEKAEARGVLDRANENARIIIENFVLSIIADTGYSIQYRQA